MESSEYKKLGLPKFIETCNRYQDRLDNCIYGLSLEDQFLKSNHLVDLEYLINRAETLLKRDNGDQHTVLSEIQINDFLKRGIKRLDEVEEFLSSHETHETMKEHKECLFRLSHYLWREDITLPTLATLLREYRRELIKECTPNKYELHCVKLDKLTRRLRALIYEINTRMQQGELFSFRDSIFVDKRELCGDINSFLEAEKLSIRSVGEVNRLDHLVKFEVVAQWGKFKITREVSESNLTLDKPTERKPVEKPKNETPQAVLLLLMSITIVMLSLTIYMKS